MSPVTVTKPRLSHAITVLLAQASERTGALAASTQVRVGHIREHEHPSTTDDVAGWIAQQGDPLLRLLWSRVAGLVGAAEGAVTVRAAAAEMAATLRATLDTLTPPDTPAEDFSQIQARTQAITDASALADAEAALSTAMAEADLVSPLHLAYVTAVIVAALQADREIKQARIVSIMAAARRQIETVLATQDEHAGLRQWAASKGGPIIVEPLTEA
jgi:hypothetical protein